MAENHPDLQEELEVDRETRLEEPPMYRVYLINDDYTPMDFVVDILMTVFRKSREDANAIMLLVHHQGKGLCGVYTYEVAETKVDTVHEIAEESGYPLRSIMERNDL
ncbi:ATP-dependent Clp protease adapter protein ClpS [Desulfoluna limicola]|uniref:ATP-dependent Clp protease adapter protein ClpS n=1 Tax=Desulfoluna limicola TaxID=2810562 RepID=A0ABM7PFK9_9BACT|nr:ATP-dependent Clp protease adapter ClpS [Desulfoluna limicola]BCS95949.1 ATP-dependent Clp protease adapter protein ClpS [Desulfoluna limicola]